MLSLFDPYIRRRERCTWLLIYFLRIDQSNIFVGFMKLLLSRLGGMRGMRLSTKREQERNQDHKIINDK